MFSSADRVVVLNKVLDDLAVYRQLQEKGCVVPPVVAAALEEYKTVKRPGVMCRYCGETLDEDKGQKIRKGTRMCENCYKFYNYFNVLYYGPKRPLATKTRSSYESMLLEVHERQERGCKIPGVAARALVEDKYTVNRLLEGVKKDADIVEARTERSDVSNPSIRRKQC